MNPALIKKYGFVKRKFFLEGKKPLLCWTSSIDGIQVAVDFSIAGKDEWVEAEVESARRSAELIRPLRCQWIFR